MSSRGVPLGINARSQRKDICVDFLRFCTSQRNNEKFCNGLKWIPIVKGAIPVDSVKPFMPDLQGLSCEFHPDVSTAATLKSGGLQWMVLSGKMSSKDYAIAMDQILKSTGSEGFKSRFNNEMMRIRDTERFINGELLLRAFQTENKNVSEKLRQRITNQVLDNFRCRELSDVLNPQQRESMRQKEINFRNFHERGGGFLLVLPTLVLVFLFSYYPALTAITHSFYRWDGSFVENFTGFENFRRMLGNLSLWVPLLAAAAFALSGALAISQKTRRILLRISTACLLVMAVIIIMDYIRSKKVFP